MQAVGVIVLNPIWFGRFGLIQKWVTPQSFAPIPFREGRGNGAIVLFLLVRGQFENAAVQNVLKYYG